MQRERRVPLLGTEDWLAVWLGFLIIAIILIFFRGSLVDLSRLVPAYRWTTDG